MSSPVQLPDMNKPTNELFIKTPGIHINSNLESIEVVAGKAKKEGEAPGKSYVKITLRRFDGYIFNGMLFPPATRAEDLTYIGQKYENGVAVRKNTPEEQLGIEWLNFGYYFIQLGMALGNHWEVVKNAIYPKLGGLDFTAIVNTFKQQFTGAGKVMRPINFKIVYNHNDKKKTSFLGFAKATVNNIVFEQFINGQEPKLQISPYEEQQRAMELVYKMQAKPKADAAGMSDPAIGSWKPMDVETNKDGTPTALF